MDASIWRDVYLSLRSNCPNKIGPEEKVWIIALCQGTVDSDHLQAGFTLPPNQKITLN
jgi:hypothetical protein